MLKDKKEKEETKAKEEEKKKKAEKELFDLLDIPENPAQSKQAQAAPSQDLLQIFSSSPEIKEKPAPVLEDFLTTENKPLCNTSLYFVGSTNVAPAKFNMSPPKAEKKQPFNSAFDFLVPNNNATSEQKLAVHLLASSPPKVTARPEPKSVRKIAQIC